jgi:hypothetical protein
MTYGIFRFLVMSELSTKTAGAGSDSASPATAMKPALGGTFLPTHAEAFDYYERRRAEHPSACVHTPVNAQENNGAWAVCADPV